jgi:hypothetical protein
VTTPSLAGPIRDEALTLALREGSPERLREGLVRLLPREGPDDEVADWRDLVMDLAPYHDCARRLGLDPRVLFEWIARKLPAEVAGTVRALGKREEVAPEEFGFALVDDPDGPRYYWTR